MIPTFFDLRTGRTAKGDDLSVFWWTEGDGACDCNRAIAFDRGALHGEGRSCLGCKRFIAIDVEGDLGYEDCDGDCRVPITKEEVLIAMNSDYGT